MIKFENDCVGCPQGCIHCGRESVPYLCCDECECEYEELYEYNGEQLCEDCLLEHFNKITLED